VSTPSDTPTPNNGRVEEPLEPLAMADYPTGSGGTPDQPGPGPAEAGAERNAPLEMACPWCQESFTPRKLHAHFLEAHPDGVRFETRKTRRVYVVECPVCGAGYDQTIKPRYEDPGFLEEFEREIRLVGFDMLVNHLLAEHGSESST
jgi:hypothetical protein